MPLAIGFVGLVAGGAERGRRRAGQARRVGPCDRVRSEQTHRRRLLTSPRTPCAHAEDACRAGPAAQARTQAFDDPDERLIDDRGRAA